MIPTPVPWPSDNQFIPITRGGTFLSDPFGDAFPRRVDIVGDGTFAAAFIAFDGTYAFFRLRVAADPRNPSGLNFANSVWGMLIDTDEDLIDSYEWQLSINGSGPLPDELLLIENTIKNSPGTGFFDFAEGTGGFTPNFSQDIVSFDIARAVLATDGSSFGPSPNWFVDWAIDITTLETVTGITDIASIPLRFSFYTSTNRITYNRDLTCAFQDFLECFTDFYVLEDLLPGIEGTIVNKENGCPIDGVVVCLYDEDGTLLDQTTTSEAGQYSFAITDAGVYTIVATKESFLSSCLCTTVEVQSDRIFLNLTLAPNCIAIKQCEIATSEELIIAEKSRVFEVFADFFLTLNTSANLSKSISMFCKISDCTGKLDESIAKVLKALTNTCEGSCE